MSDLLVPTDSAATRHVPERTCVACRKKRPQHELVRLAKFDGGWKVENGRQRSGRGVYLCADSSTCWQEKRLRRTFGAYAEAVSQMLEPEQQSASPRGIQE